MSKEDYTEDYTEDIDIIQGKSYILKNKEVTTDLTIIQNNNFTILNLICPPQLSEGVPPEKKGLKQNSPKNKHFIYTSIACVHQ